jgi:hypothetical protein
MTRAAGTSIPESLTEGRTPAEACRVLKRKISNAIYAAALRTDAAARAAGPGGQPGKDSSSSANGCAALIAPTWPLDRARRGAVFMTLPYPWPEDDDHCLSSTKTAPELVFCAWLVQRGRG